MAHAARLLITMDKGGVHSVGNENRVMKGNQRNGTCFRSGTVFVYRVIVKKRGNIQYYTLMEPPSDPG